MIRNASKNVYKILVGNKCDLEDKRKVTFEQGKEFADTFGMKFIETSAKTSQNVEESFKTMTKEIIDIMVEKEKKIVKEKVKDENKVTLSNKPGQSINNKNQ